MCDKSEAEPARNSRKLIDGFCNKCKQQAPNASIRNAQFCRTCLAASIELKYRQNIFKSGLEKGLNVLVALSGSPSSRCVLDIVKKSHDPSARGNQFATVYVCNVQEYPLEFAEEESIVVVPLSEKDPNLRQMIIFNALLENAKELNCKCVILGDNQTKIAIKTISYTAKGRGLSLVNEISICQEVDGIKFIRPLRDTVAKEIGLYNYWNNVKSYRYPPLQKQPTSIDSITTDFIVGLDAEFPSTVSTVARTAFRIPKRTVEGTCPLCYGPKDDIDDFTKLMQKVDDEPKTIVSGVEESQLVEEACTKAECCGGDACASKAKDINALPLLCYACRNIYKAKIELPQFAVTNARRQLNREEMRESIQWFIIED